MVDVKVSVDVQVVVYQAYPAPPFDVLQPAMARPSPFVVV
jgi:hypothetical protein